MRIDFSVFLFIENQLISMIVTAKYISESILPMSGFSCLWFTVATPRTYLFFFKTFHFTILSIPVFNCSAIHLASSIVSPSYSSSKD